MRLATTSAARIAAPTATSRPPFAARSRPSPTAIARSCSASSTRWLAQPGSLRLNAGELTDSLALDGVIPLVDDLVPRFAAQDRHTLLLVTKSANVGNLLKYDPRGQVIVAFSVNATEVSASYEKGPPEPMRRIEAAARVKEAGYQVTLRLDPMIPIEGWREAYARFLEEACRIVTPDQWTLGSLRYFTSLPMWTRKVGRDPSVFRFGSEWTPGDRRRRIPLSLRAAMYSTAMDVIRQRQGDVAVRLCKETAALHRRLGTDRQIAAIPRQRQRWKMVLSGAMERMLKLSSVGSGDRRPVNTSVMRSAGMEYLSSFSLGYGQKRPAR